MSKCKLVHYIGDYGPGNFWENVTRADVTRDLDFIVSNKFNTIMLLIPFATFRPNQHDNECEHLEMFDYIIKQCTGRKLKVMIRIGYLWDTTFSEDRTLERYMDMYTNYVDGTRSKYEDAFIDYVKHYHNHPSVCNIVISWEDFFWPVAFVEENRYSQEELKKRSINLSKDSMTVRDSHWPYYGDEPVDNIYRVYVEHLIKKCGNLPKLIIEQRSNGIFNKILPNKRNDNTYMSYFNPYSLRGQWYKMIKKDFTHVHDNLVAEKQFMEWYSRVADILKIKMGNKLIINQFNLIDNTYDDDAHHNKNVGYNIFKEKKYLDNTEQLFDFYDKVLPVWLEGIGVWALWSTINGGIYNGTFKYGTKGWETTGEHCKNHGINLKTNQHLSTNVGYTRVDRKKCNVLIVIYSERQSELTITLGVKKQNVKISPGTHRYHIKFDNTEESNLTIVNIGSDFMIRRVDYYNMKLKSFMYDETKSSLPHKERMVNLLNKF